MPPFLLSLIRPLSQSTSIPKSLPRVRDHSFDSLMEVEKKVRRALKLIPLILSNPQQHTNSLPVSLLSSLSRRLHFPSSSLFLLRHPHVFHLFLHPVLRSLHCRLTPRALRLLSLHSSALSLSLPSSALRLRRLLLLSSRLPLHHLRLLRSDLALPDDFEHSLILSNPSLFRLITTSNGQKFVEAVHNADEPLPVAAVELSREREYRNRGLNAEDARFAFPIHFPPGFKIGKYYRIAIWKWQRLPYWSPYEDVSGYDLRSLEARRRMEKRAVAAVHELLSLMVERRTTMERIAGFREVLGLPGKLKEFLLRHQGIFYVSTRGNGGKLHTVFLREGYRKGELVEVNDVWLARRGMRELLLMSAKKVNFDRMLTSLGRRGDGKEFFGDEDVGVGGEGEDSGSDSGVESQFVE